MIRKTNWINKITAVTLIIPVIIITGIQAVGQPPARLTIEQAYQLARKNYPLIKQRDLITKTRDYSVSNAAKAYLPVVSFNGQATYQSAVTTFPFSIPVPGFKLPVYSKDQYKIYGEVDQTIYDGGAIRNEKLSAEASQVIQQQSLEVQLYAIYDRVNQLFFGALLINEQIRQNDLLIKDIQNGIDKTRTLLANGTVYRSSVDELVAQLLQADQSKIELEATRRAYLDMLALFMNSPVNDVTVLEKPVAPVISAGITRPELLYYEYQKKLDDVQERVLKTQLLPKLGFFAQEGYGRPGLNPLSNDFQWYYIGGLKLSWNLGSLYTLKNQRRLINIDRQTLDIQREAFLFNTAITQKQQSADIEKYYKLIKKDDDIINLRTSVKTAAGAQLENGVLSAHDYLTEVDAEDQARQNRILHEMQLLQSQYSYQNTIGNIKNQ